MGWRTWHTPFWFNTSNKKKVLWTYFEASNYCISPFGMLKDCANKNMKENSTLQNSIQFNSIQLPMELFKLWKTCAHFLNIEEAFFNFEKKTLQFIFCKSLCLDPSHFVLFRSYFRVFVEPKNLRFSCVCRCVWERERGWMRWRDAALRLVQQAWQLRGAMDCRAPVLTCSPMLRSFKPL
jgi:hypothetical protein